MIYRLRAARRRLTALLPQIRLIVLSAPLLALLGCGGGTITPVPPPPPGGTNWQPGVFLDANTFFARCAAPRSGINPATNSPYPDIQGRVLDENNFLRSYSNDTYLWYDEIVDQDPGLFNDPLVYFDELRTFETTPSGADKDKFHFTFDSLEWFKLSQSGATLGYGMQIAIMSAAPPREILVAYTEPNSPAFQESIVRGAEFVSVDGELVVNGDADVLNAAFFPSDTSPNPQPSHTFEIRDPGQQATRFVTMTPIDFISDPVLTTDVISTANGQRVGYLLFNDHIATAEQGLIDAVNQLNSGLGIDDLVLDVRYNGGGFLAIASELAYMIAGANATAGRTFELLQFNAKHPSTNPITGQPISPTPFYNQTLGPPFNGNGGQAGQPLPTLDLSRVFVITGPGTCSASESIMNSLRGVDVEVIQIGSTTCGKPYGFFPTDNCGTTYFTIQFRGINEKGFGDYTDGFSPANTPVSEAGTVIPGCSVADDFTNQLGDPAEGRLSVALDMQAGQSCPAPSGFAPGTFSKIGAPRDAVEAIVPKSPWHTNRIVIP